MIKSKLKLLTAACFWLAFGFTAKAQMTLTIEKALEISVENSPDLQKSLLSLERAQELLHAQEASLKSRFSLDLNPVSYSQNRQFDQRLSQWYTNRMFSTSGTFSISQPIIWTDATISLNNRFSWQNNRSDISGGGQNHNKAFSNDLYLSLDQPLFTYNATKMELQTLEMDYENALISYALQRLNMERSITTQFYNVYSAQNNLNISEEELSNAKINYEAIKNKVEADLAPKSELFQAELNLATAQSTVENSQVSLENAKDELKQILGLPLSEEIITLVTVSADSVKIDPEKAIANAFSSRLELRQREFTRKEAEFELIRVKDENKLKGNLGVSVGIIGDNQNLGNIYQNPTTNPQVAVSFSVPIFDWGARKSRIKAQEKSIEMEEIDAAEELKQIEMDIRQVCRNLDNLLLQIDIAKRSVENAQLTYDLNAERYRNGELTGMEMSQFQTQLSNQKTSYTQTLINYKLELLNLKILSLYDFEKSESIIPLELYSPVASTDKKKRK